MRAVVLALLLAGCGATEVDQSVGGVPAGCREVTQPLTGTTGTTTVLRCEEAK